MPAWCRARKTSPINSRLVMENHEPVAVPVALRIHAIPKMIAAMMASMPRCFPFREVLTGRGHAPSTVRFCRISRYPAGSRCAGVQHREEPTVVTWTARRRGRGTRSARSAGRKAAASTAIRVLARAGLVARGVMYVVIGWIAVQIAFEHSGQQADRTGALHAIGATPAGGARLWLLVIGFTGMALWRLCEAAYGSPGTSTRKPSQRVAALGKAVVYAVVAYSVLKYAAGAGSPKSSDSQSVDLTATLMKYPGGRILVIVVGLALIGGGIYLAYQAWKKQFRQDLRLG